MWYKDAETFKKLSGHEINGSWFPRVTRILEIKSNPGLDSFMKEVGSEAAEVIKNKSAEEGTLVHEVVQKVALGEAVEVPEEIKSSVSRFQEVYEERKILFHPDYIERPIWSAQHRYSGTVDALAEIDGKFGVLDIKTSTGFYPEYNLQTGAYIQALQEFEIKKALALPREIETRWILRVNQHKLCKQCGATLREKGGRSKVRTSLARGVVACKEEEHNWGETIGDVELKEFPYYHRDVKAFLAAKTLWEWENDYWLRTIGYAK